MLTKTKLAILALGSLFFVTPTTFAKKKKYHCEIEKDGKFIDLEKIKKRKECKKANGKWVKAHDQGDHNHENHDHE